MSSSNYALHLRIPCLAYASRGFLRKSISYCTSNLNVAYSLDVEMLAYSLIYVIKK